jgi:hypothetical protein
VSDGVTTPRVTGSWLIFRDLAIALAIRLTRATPAMLSANPLVRNPQAARDAIAWANRLLELSLEFDRWPQDPERASEQRAPLSSELFTLQRETEELLTKMRGGPW